MAVETVLEFDKEIKETGFKILNKVKNFVGEIENVFEEKNISRRNTKRENKNHFTNFIVNLIQTLFKYKDEDLEYLVIIINSELKRQRDSTFHDITANSDIQKLLSDKIATVKNKPATEIRHYLKALANKLSVENYVNKEEKKLLGIVNSMCKEESVTELNKFIKDLDDYRLKARKNMDLSQLVRTGLESILYEPYFRLRVNLRSNLTSESRNYLKAYYDLINLDSKYSTVSQTVSELTSPSQNYIEKILDFSGLKQYFKKWVSDVSNKKSSTTPITHRPTNPTTDPPLPVKRKEKIEFIDSDDDNDDTDDVIPKKRDKNSITIKHKTTFKKDSAKLKERGDGTSEESTTLKQVYLEKNLDLKYKPFSYEHSSSATKQNKRIRTSSTTRKPQKKPHLERYMKQKRIQKQDSVIFNESKQKFDDTDSDSTDLSKLTSKRRISSKYTKTPERFGRTVLRDDFEPDFRSQTKNRHRKSKPDFVEHRSEYKMRSDKQSSYGDRELYTFKPGIPNVIELVKDIGYSIDIKKEKDLELSDETNNVKSSR